MGAQIKGYALPPSTTPSLFVQARVEEGVESEIADIREYEKLEVSLSRFDPEVVFHLAAQPLVLDSYEFPRETYQTNVMGTVNLLEAVRLCSRVRSVVVVTTDKCYENREWLWGYRENDRLGGYDPYSSSKAAAEFVVSAYRSSFFNPRDYGTLHRVAVASARAGNVIGGGDWAKDRLVPDLFRAYLAGETVTIRNPGAVRPWQHVLEPLSGYMILAERLYESVDYAEAWNFGPYDRDCCEVRQLSSEVAKHLPGLNVVYSESNGLHEAILLKLDISKATSQLGWTPRWNFVQAVRNTARLYRAIADSAERARELVVDELSRYQQL
jgi:CDP-glucose 4,6-dehydratase